VEIGKLAGPWSMVGKANGEVLSNKVTSVVRASISGWSLANQQKAMFVCMLNVPNEQLHGVQHSCACHQPEE
jgi:hypothetical protein